MKPATTSVDRLAAVVAPPMRRLWKPDASSGKPASWRRRLSSVVAYWCVICLPVAGSRKSGSVSSASFFASYFSTSQIALPPETNSGWESTGRYLMKPFSPAVSVFEGGMSSRTEMPPGACLSTSKLTRPRCMSVLSQDFRDATFLPRIKSEKRETDCHEVVISAHQTRCQWLPSRSRGRRIARRCWTRMGLRGTRRLGENLWSALTSSFSWYDPFSPFEPGRRSYFFP
mmetsp:Transcript_5294/g.18787  ORF Transcript_5294/g.18787 Transcript_5294/m.18787 type:complete len:229 (-) Transcript_5294:120-806(-)